MKLIFHLLGLSYLSSHLFEFPVCDCYKLYELSLADLLDGPSANHSPRGNVVIACFRMALKLRMGFVFLNGGEKIYFEEGENFLNFKAPCSQTKFY